MFGRMLDKRGQSPRRIAALQAAPTILPTIRTPRKTAAFSCLGGCWTRGDSPPTDCCAAGSSRNPANHSNSAENRCVLMFGRMLDKRGQSPDGLLRCRQLPQSCQPFELRGKPLRSHVWAGRKVSNPLLCKHKRIDTFLPWGLM